MREILFKAKRTDNGEWVKGFYTLSTNSAGEERHYIVRYCSYVWHEVKPSTLCQYTGLTAKNGKKIWENDILMANSNPQDIYRVCFGEFGVMNMENEEITDNAVGYFMKVIPTECILSIMKPFNADLPLNNIWIENCELKVVGNVFDNPELLNGGAE